MYILFKKSFCADIPKLKYIVEGQKLKFSKMFLKGEKKKFKTFLSRLWFYILTFGKTYLYSVRDEQGILMHVSCVVSKCYKFPFMKENDLEIGPCVTFAQYRGKGIYPYVLNTITSDKQFEKSDFYMLVHETNISSIRGVEKAGFERSAIVEKTGLFGNYKIKEQI